MSDKETPKKQVSEKTKIQFIKEHTNGYSLHPSFGPIIKPKIGDVGFFDKDIAQQIIDDKWGVEAEIEPEELVDDEDEIDPEKLPYPEKLLRDFNAGDVTEEIVKGLLEEFAKEQLGIPADKIDKRKSVKNLVDDLLIEIEIQEENDD